MLPRRSFATFDDTDLSDVLCQVNCERLLSSGVPPLDAYDVITRLRALSKSYRDATDPSLRRYIDAVASAFAPLPDNKKTPSPALEALEALEALVGKETASQLAKLKKFPCSVGRVHCSIANCLCLLGRRCLFANCDGALDRPPTGSVEDRSLHLTFIQSETSSAENAVVFGRPLKLQERCVRRFNLWRTGDGYKLVRAMMASAGAYALELALPWHVRLHDACLVKRHALEPFPSLQEILGVSNATVAELNDELRKHMHCTVRETTGLALGTRALREEVLVRTAEREGLFEGAVTREDAFAEFGRCFPIAQALLIHNWEHHSSDGIANESFFSALRMVKAYVRLKQILPERLLPSTNAIEFVMTDPSLLSKPWLITSKVSRVSTYGPEDDDELLKMLRSADAFDRFGDTFGDTNMGFLFDACVFRRGTPYPVLVFNVLGTESKTFEMELTSYDSFTAFVNRLKAFSKSDCHIAAKLKKFMRNHRKVPDVEEDAPLVDTSKLLKLGEWLAYFFTSSREHAELRALGFFALGVWPTELLAEPWRRADA